MDKDQSAVSKFMGELEGDKSPFEKIPEDPFEQTETPKEEVEKEEKPLPFNKDPKIQKFIEKEIARKLEGFKGNEVIKETPQEDNEVKEVLEELIGNDTPQKVAMVKKFQNILEQGTVRARQEALKELDNRANQEAQADQEAEQELENAFDNIEETFDVDLTSNNPIARKTRQEFVTFVEKIAPKDRNGEIVDYPDMASAWETFSEMRKSTPSRAKELASRSMSRSAESQGATPTKRVTFDDAQAFVDSLKA